MMQCRCIMYDRMNEKDIQDIFSLMAHFVTPGNQTDDSDIPSYIRDPAHDIHNMASRYEDKWEELQGYVTQHIRSETFSTCGSGAFRGYYTPTPVICKLAKIKKGRLLKARPAAGDYFTYQFDENDKLICICRFFSGRLNQCEFIIRETPDEEYGLVFSIADVPLLVSGNKTIYNSFGCPTAFFSMHMPLMIGRNPFQYEAHDYQNDKLTASDVILQGIYPSNVYRMMRFSVEMDGTNIKLTPIP